MAGKFWTKSWNFCIGCAPKDDEANINGTACRNCWAKEMVNRWGGKEPRLSGCVKDGEWTGEAVVLSERIDMPTRWQRPEVVAVNWLGDLAYGLTRSFEHSLSGQTAFFFANEAPQHEYLWLTKKPEFWHDYLMLDFDKSNDAYNPKFYLWEEWSHHWWGATAYDHRTWRKALRWLSYLHRLGANTWVCAEPLMGEIGFMDGDWDYIDWLVVGLDSQDEDAADKVGSEAFYSLCEAAYTHDVPVWTKKTPGGTIYRECPEEMESIFDREWGG